MWSTIEPPVEKASLHWDLVFRYLYVSVSRLVKVISFIYTRSRLGTVGIHAFRQPSHAATADFVYYARDHLGSSPYARDTVKQPALSKLFSPWYMTVAATEDILVSTRNIGRGCRVSSSAIRRVDHTKSNARTGYALLSFDAEAALGSSRLICALGRGA